MFLNQMKLVLLPFSKEQVFIKQTLGSKQCQTIVGCLWVLGAKLRVLALLS